MREYTVTREIPGWWVETWTVTARNESAALRKLRDCKDLSRPLKNVSWNGGGFVRDLQLGDMWEAEQEVLHHE